MRALAAFAAMGMAFGIVDGWLAATQIEGAGVLAVSHAAALTGLIGVLLGGLYLIIARALRPWRRPRELASLLAAAGSRDGIDREPVVRLHSWVAAGAAAMVVFAVIVRWVIRRSWNFEDERFAVAFSSGVTVCAALAAVVGVLVVRPALAAGFRRIDARVRLPVPPWPVLRYGLLIAAPITGLLAPFAFADRELLGAHVAAAVWSMCLVACVPIAGYGLRALQRFPRIGRATELAIPGIVIGLTGITVATYDSHPRDAAALEHTVGALAGADIVRFVSDFDRDGASSLLGGGDCAPFDGDRGPRAREVPGNGIDEDCDGKDLPRMQTGVLLTDPLSSGALAPGQTRPYNVVWLIVDAVRADHVGALGYQRPTTPAFDALAKESLLFTDALSQSSRTFFSVPSMFLGLNPGSIEWVRARKIQQPVEGHESIAEMLAAEGYRTGIVLPGGMHRDYTGLQQGFTDRVSYFLDDRWKHWRERGAPVATSKAIELLERWLGDGPEPFFLVAHYIDPHNPYTPQRDKSYPAFGPRTAAAPDAYDEEIAYADRYIGFLLDHLRSKPEVWDRTIVVIAADHGEEFREHGRLYHGQSCFIESVHVPLLVRVPGLAPRVIDNRVGLVDIVPTLLELTGISTEVELHGQSLLVPALTPGAVSPKRPFFCATASMSGRGYLRRSVRMGDFSLHFDATSGAYQVFDRRTDPGEQHDLWGRAPVGADVDLMIELLGRSATGTLKTLY
ncbi:MAG TPA: sulfatase [Kofleriaceae bacterium]|nr:sulfatase [Kofleriaceae bacterium]